ncbi:hypothetical protein [Saccharopolyspora pogona]|uniref:hypothetical protein n=1 Tax=Saccharopolyspora pogona TaxID=333966 RepID=UPI001684E726|nr:hypothetical protein [Saccharopolyspora pogona]
MTHSDCLLCPPATDQGKTLLTSDPAGFEERARESLTVQFAQSSGQRLAFGRVVALDVQQQRFARELGEHLVQRRHQPGSPAGDAPLAVVRERLPLCRKHLMASGVPPGRYHIGLVLHNGFGSACPPAAISSR